MRTPGTPEHETVRRHLPGLERGGAGLSEAAALWAMIRVGAETIQQEVVEAGYTDLAAEQDAEDTAFHRAIRTRGARRSSGDD